MPTTPPAPTLKAVYGQLVSLSAPATQISALAFLQEAAGKPRYYWRHRDITLAGVGTALEIKAIGDGAMDDIRRQIQDLFAQATIQAEHPLATPRLFGGFSFFSDFVPDQIWSIYFPAHFVLPHYQFLRLGDEQWLTINVQIPIEDDPTEVLPDLHIALDAKIAELSALALPPTQELSRISTLSYPMSFPTWRDNIEAILGAIHADEVQKVVLARACEMRFASSPNLLYALDYLSAAYPECYRFLFEPRPGYAFLGATPELLLRVDGSSFQTMGLAGSIRRGATPQEDQALAQELLHRPKDRHEHQLVVEAIREGLQPVSESLTVGDADILTLSNIQHIHTPIQGTRKPDQDSLALLKILHPTPALGGKPRDKALAMIQDLEGVPRGWYAAPIGWLDGNLNAEFGVAIRSAVAQDNRVWAYAGAGIVTGSDPQAEWNETALKFTPMLRAFAHE